MQESLGREDQQMPRSYPAELRRQVRGTSRTAQRPGHPVLALELGSPYGRLTGPRFGPHGVSTFHTRKLRPGRAPSIAWGRSCSSRPTTSIGLHPAHHNVASLHGATTSTGARLRLTSPQRGVQAICPSGLPLVRRHQMDRQRLWLSPKLRTPRLLAAHVGAGRIIEHGSETQRYVIDLASNLAGLLDTCDLVSHSC